MSQQALRQVLPQLPISLNRNVLVSSKTFDDAGVYRLDRHRALVQTVDFFTPIVDDPFSYGQIAAANSLSDIYAMGGRPLTALNIIGFPEDLVRPRVISSILRGGLAKAAEVGCVIIGGHSIRNPEPIYGLAVTGLVDVRRVTTNANARPGDALVLTKPLGTGIATTAIKRGMASRALQKNVIALMSQINTVGADLAELGLVRAATDITGYGLIGHLISLCRASGVSADIDPAAVPIISYEIHELVNLGCVPQGTRDNLNGATVLVDWARTDETCQVLLTDAQTSGGLLLCVAEANLGDALKVLRKAGTPFRRADWKNRPATTSPPIDMHDRMRCDKRRQIPAVSKILDALGYSDLPRPFVVEIVRRKLSQIRASSADPRIASRLSLIFVARSMNFAPADFNRSSTELELSFTQISDAPRSRAKPLHALNEIAAAYSNLEYDLVKGERGGRGAYVESALALLCEAEAATVVNNCAAALLLIVQHFTRKAGRARTSPGATGGYHFTGRTGANRRRISHQRNCRRGDRREIARGRRDQQDHTRRLRARRWTRNRDDSESAPQQFFHERLCRIAFFERDQRRWRRRSGFRLSKISAAAR